MKSNYTNLDLLRSFAVMSVVTAHLWHVCVEFHFYPDDPGVNQFLHNLSYTGVMFFFVHTCLVLMLSMHRMPAARLGRSFLIRRAFRIYPLCWAAILLALATGLTDLPGNNLHALGWKGLAANLLLVQNVLHGERSVIGPLWSLPWEVQMYLVLPLFFFILRRFVRVYVAFGLWLAATLLALAATQPGVSHLHATVFPPMFISGMVAYRLLARQSQAPRSHLLPAWAWPLFVLCLFALQPLLIGYHLLDSPYGAGIDSCICLALSLAIPFFDELRAGWIVHPMRQIAKYSYGVYLLHVPAVIFAFRCLHGLPLTLTVAASLALTGLLSFVSFHVLENPLIQLGKCLAQRAQGASKAISTTVRALRPAVLDHPDFPAQTPAD